MNIFKTYVVRVLLIISFSSITYSFWLSGFYAFFHVAGIGWLFYNSRGFFKPLSYIALNKEHQLYVDNYNRDKAIVDSSLKEYQNLAPLGFVEWIEGTKTKREKDYIYNIIRNTIFYFVWMFIGIVFLDTDGYFYFLLAYNITTALIGITQKMSVNEHLSYTRYDSIINSIIIFFVVKPYFRELLNVVL
jgi:hypothetical protein